MHVHATLTRDAISSTQTKDCNSVVQRGMPSLSRINFAASLRYVPIKSYRAPALSDSGDGSAAARARRAAVTSIRSAANGVCCWRSAGLVKPVTPLGNLDRRVGPRTDVLLSYTRL